MHQVSAIILAAGRSERMGAFKPLLPFGDTTVIKACINYLRAGGIDDIVVVVGHNAGQLRNELRDTRVKCVLNPDTAGEMNTSIACGVGALPADQRATVIALADQPAIPPEVVLDLVNEWKSGALLVKPSWGGRGGHPVLVDLTLRDQLLNLDPLRGLKAVFDANPATVRRVEVESPYVARDMDTWDDYCTLHQEVFGEAPPRPNI
jgi:molybdenum cofactor cytidylyltransferase